MKNDHYIGKICPYCHTPIKPGANLYVCDSCDMPHHKTCWIENRACTTYGCKGSAIPVKLDDKGLPLPERIVNLHSEPSGRTEPVSPIVKPWKEPVVLFLKTFLRLASLVFIFFFVLIRITDDISVPAYYYYYAIVVFLLSFAIDKLIPED